MDGMNIFIFFFTFHYRCYTLNLDNIGLVVTGKNVKITQCIYKRYKRQKGDKSVLNDMSDFKSDTDIFYHIGTWDFG